MTTKKQITAKFTGRCTTCRNPVASGTRCNWESGKGVSHIVCPKTFSNYQENRNAADFISEGGLPPVSEPQKKVTVTMGVFKKDGRIYVVKPNKEKTRVYAKEIVESPARMTENGAIVDFETRYAPGIVFKLTEADRWDLADAKDFLTKFSRCIVCGRHLKAAKSVERSIGPVCAGYFKSSSHVNACADHDSTAPKGAVAAADVDDDRSMRRAIELIAEDSNDTAAEDAAHAYERLIERERQDWIDSKSTLTFDDWRREEITRHHFEEAEAGLL
jgi:hypothetical protein